jgi:hypothetical protein
MKKITLLSTFLFCIFLQSIGQTYCKPRLIGTPNFYSNNNTVVCEAYNMSPNGFLMKSESQSQTPPVSVNNFDTLTNFGIDTMHGPLSSSIDFYSSNGYLSHAWLFSSVVLPKFNYEVSAYTTPSGIGTADGSITLTFDSLVPFSSMLFSQWNNTLVDTTLLDPHTIRFDSLANEYLQILLGNPSDASDYLAFRIFIGNPDYLYVNTGLDMNISVVHAGNNCNGLITINPTNSQDIVYNIWSDDHYNEPTRTFLCPGVYSVYTYDLDANAMYNHGSIDTIVITNNTTAYIDSSIFNYAIQDTNYFNSINCDFNYNLPIDSVTYVEDTIYNSGGIVIVSFDLTMYQGNTIVTISDSLTIDADSLIMLDVAIYCDQFKSTFKGERIAYLRGASEHHFYQSGVLAAGNLNELEYELYPNPASDILHITFPEEFYGDVRVYDSSGKLNMESKLSGEKIFNCDVSNLSKGIYFLRFQSDSATSQTKFIVK